MENIPRNSRLYALGIDQCVPIVFDMTSYPWKREVHGFVKNDFGKSVKQMYEFLKAHGYDYLVLDVSSLF